MRIEEQFREGNIRTIFCTSTLIEGVNLPADNLFVTSYKRGLSKMDEIDFRNLVGRVGRIKYNLYGNVFLVSLVDDKGIKAEEYEKLLSNEIPDQKLSVAALTKSQKERIVTALVNGKLTFDKEKKDTYEDLYVMRKFSLILLRDIKQGRNSLVRQEFSKFLTPEREDKIREVFVDHDNRIDNDINISIDQTVRLSKEIAKGLHYTTIGDNGYIDRDELIDFLEKLCKIFAWDKNEPENLGRRDKNGRHSNLRWYAVILSQWVKGHGLQYIIDKAIQNKRTAINPLVYIHRKPVPYEYGIPHNNVVIGDTLDIIESVILFSLSNYFLKFSEEYKRQHGGKPFGNDWYEFVEYGTTNPLTIMLQRYGIKREIAIFIKEHPEYIERVGGEVKLKKSLAQCGTLSVENEIKDVMLNVPDLFVD
jgi:hypothetical protein